MRNFLNILDNSHNNSNSFTTVQQVRLDIIGELEAIVQYENHIAQTNDKVAQSTLKSIVREEKVYVGELMALLFYLDEESKVEFENGLKEFKNINNL